MANELEGRLAELERRLTDLGDREAIRDVIHRYCRAVDRCDVDLLKACYWPDAIDDHGFFGGNAWEFADYVVPTLRKIEASVHAITNTIIDLNGDKAFCESQYSVVHRLRDEDRLLDYWHQGRYLDIFEKRDGVWKIAVRTLVTDMDRLLRTKDMRAMLGDPLGETHRGPNNSAPRGARSPNDPGAIGFDLPSTAQTRTPMADLWAGFYALGKVL